MPGQIPPVETPAAQAATPPANPTAQTQQATPPNPSVASSTQASPKAAQSNDDVLVEYDTDDAKIKPLVSRANAQAAKFRDARNTEREARAKVEQAAAATRAELEALKASHAATSQQILAFKEKLVDNYLADALRAAGATPAQAAKLAPGLRTDAKDIVKVDEKFNVTGDVKAQVEQLAKDFGFTPTDNPSKPTGAGDGSKPPTSAPGAAGGNPNPNTINVLGRNGLGRNNQPLANPHTTPDDNRAALTLRVAQSLQASGWGKDQPIQVQPPATQDKK